MLREKERSARVRVGMKGRAGAAYRPRTIKRMPVMILKISQMMLKITEKITRILLAITLLCSCGGAGKPSGIPEDTTPKGPAGGLSDARNRKAIIEQLGSRYQQSASGQYRKRIASVAPFKMAICLRP